MRTVLLVLCVTVPLSGEVLDFPALWSRDYPVASPNAVENPRISDACEARARALATLGVLSHVDADGARVGQQMLARGLEPGEWGEILGAGPDWPSIFQGWKASATHRELLEDTRWAQVGWGSSRRGTQLVVVVRFWRP